MQAIIPIEAALPAGVVCMARTRLQLPGRLLEMDGQGLLALPTRRADAS